MQEQKDQTWWGPSLKIIGKTSNILLPRQGDVGYDLISDTDPLDGGEFGHEYIEYDTGVIIEPPAGFFAAVFPRSSVSNYALSLSNSVGIIDPSYRGTIKVRFRGPTKLERELDGAKVYYKGDKIAQLVLLPYAVFPMEVAELSETERSGGGFGSTGV